MRKNKEADLKVHFAVAAIAVFALTIIVSQSVAAQIYQKDWVPNEYRLHCDESRTYKDVTLAGLRSRSVPCKGETVEKKVVKHIKEAMSSLKALGFRAPLRFGERFGAGKRGNADYIRLYDVDTGGIASTRAPCPNTTISIGQGIYKWWKDYLVFEFLAHESFHVVSHAYPTTTRNCDIPAGWIFEGIADAVALDLTRKKYGDTVPDGNEVDKVHAKFAGLRRYDVPLNFNLKDEEGEAIQTGLSIHYNTSSLFRFIAEAFHGGEYKYLHNYMLHARKARDWMAWLNDNVEKKDDATKKHLGLVHSAFASSFAGWGDPGLPGNKHYGRKKWLKRAFGGCQTVRLSRSNTAASVEMSLRPSSAKCVEVTVAGVGPEDRLTVQVAAIDRNMSVGRRFKIADQLYLGLAESTDSEQFHCARWIKNMGKEAIRHCGFIGDTGTLEIGGNKHQARVWNVIAQKSGKKPKVKGRSQSPARMGKMSNLYLVSRMHPKPSDKIKTSDGGEDEPFTLWFMLDVGDLEVSPAPVTSKPRGKVSKKVVGHINGEPVTNSQETVPMQNTKGDRTVTYTNPAVVRPSMLDNMPSVPMAAMSVLKDLHTLQLSFVWSKEISTYEDTIDDFETYAAQPLKKQGKRWVHRSIKVGETGTFPASVTGGLMDGSEMMASKEPGTIVIHEFTYYTLRATITATLCNVLKMTKDNTCPNKRTVKGRIIKGFPGARMPGKAFTIHNTPGTAIYRRAKGGDLSDRSSGDGPGGDGSGFESGGGGGDGTTSGGGKSCDCSCKAYSDMRKLAGSLKGKRPTPAQLAKLRKMAMCSRQCSTKWAICKKKR